MSSSRSLIAEPPLLVLPSLAVAIGVNQAILLQQLHFLSLIRKADRQGLRWVELGNGDLLHTFPFWSRNTVWRMVWQLRDKGLLIVKQEPGAENAYRLDYEAIERAVENPCKTREQAGGNPAQPGQGTLPNLGTHPAQPGEGTLPNLGSPTIKELSEDTKRKQNGDLENTKAEDLRACLGKMTRTWSPDEDTKAEVRAIGVTDAFMLNLLPEFRAYWIERDVARPWGSAFIAHCRRQWNQRGKGAAPASNTARPAEDQPTQPRRFYRAGDHKVANPASPETAAQHVQGLKKLLRIP